MKHLAKVFMFALVLALAFALAACGDTHTHTAGETWEKDASEHWHVCTECGEEMDRAAHMAGVWEYDAESGKDVQQCTVCDHKMNERTHEHTADESEWQSDDTDHWRNCSACGQKIERYDQESGKEKMTCTCGHVSEREHEHTADESEWQSDGAKHWRNCSVCGQKVESTQVAHTPDESEWKSDDTDHWRNCSVCGQEVESTQAAHSGTWEYDQESGKEKMTCTCGHVSERTHEHTADESEWQSDDTDHWRNCSACGQKIESEWAYDAESGKDVKLCIVCDYKMSEREHVHAYTVWTSGEGGDVASCACGEEFSFTQQKVDLDVQYADLTGATVNTEKTVTVDLSVFGNISDVTAKMLAYEGSINMYNREGKDIASSFAEGTLTVNVSEFGFAYGDRTVAITFNDEENTERTVHVPVLLVTKVIMSKTDLDNMTYFSKESEKEADLIYGGYFELGTDIPYSGQFKYVMPTNIDAAKGGFVGVFDGCGYNIDGIQINTADVADKWNNYHGMFGSLYGGTVKNVSFTNVVIGVKGSLISAYGSGTIENVYAQFKEMRVNNQLGLAFSQGVGSGGATIKDCVVDVSEASFNLVSGGTTYHFCFFGKQSSWTDPETQETVYGPKPNLQGAYLIGTLPEGTTTWTDEANSTGTFGKYDSMAAFAAAYNALDSELKAEIDTWDKTYWQVTEGSIAFIDKSAA